MSDLDIPERRTVDGVVVKRGDIVWREVSGYVTRRKLATHDLGWSWPIRHADHAYSTEALAVAAALAANTRRVAKAKQEIRTATRAVARLRARLESLR